MQEGGGRRGEDEARAGLGSPPLETAVNIIIITSSKYE